MFRLKLQSVLTSVLYDIGERFITVQVRLFLKEWKLCQLKVICKRGFFARGYCHENFEFVASWEATCKERPEVEF